MRCLPDANVAIFVIRQRPPQALAVFNRQAGRMALSAITLAELMHGAEKSSRPTANLAVVEDFCSRLEVLPCGPKAAQHNGQIRAALEPLGTPIGVNDLHVAAHARSEGLVVVTNNRREFDRVPALQVEDWSL
ncbi:MAG: tRNA(fMet)-specific endonuclease VapC [Rubrivivax sp.]|nr:tRNA(fMet)-specific endonuclease VapC [Rubrivivax sp.]